MWRIIPKGRDALETRGIIKPAEEKAGGVTRDASTEEAIGCANELMEILGC